MLLPPFRNSYCKGCFTFTTFYNPLQHAQECRYRDWFPGPPLAQEEMVAISALPLGKYGLQQTIQRRQSTFDGIVMTIFYTQTRLLRRLAQQIYRYWCTAFLRSVPLHQYIYQKPVVQKTDTEKWPITNKVNDYSLPEQKTCNFVLNPNQEKVSVPTLCDHIRMQNYVHRW